MTYPEYEVTNLKTSRVLFDVDTLACQRFYMQSWFITNLLVWEKQEVTVSMRNKSQC